MNRYRLLQIIVSLALTDVFLVGCGTPTVTSQPTPVPPTATLVPPTATPVPPTATLVPPTPTSTPTNTPTPTLTPKPTIMPTPIPEIQASFGTLVVKRAQLSKVFPLNCISGCIEPTKPGHIFLVVILDSKEGGDTEAIGGKLGDQSLWSQISVTTSDGFRATVGGGGKFLGDLFIELSVPQESKGFTLYWADNPPIELKVR